MNLAAQGKVPEEHLCHSERSEESAVAAAANSRSFGRFAPFRMTVSADMVVGRSVMHTMAVQHMELSGE
jgi:hypothetical protein